MLKINSLPVWLVLLVLILDQASKWLCVLKLPLHEPLAVLPGFNLLLVHNLGAAFSFLANGSGWQRWFFIGITLTICSLILVFWQQLTAQNKSDRWALALILGGALGNLWDRLHHGYVIDFIQVYYQEWAWPVFNLADTAISLGAAILILSSILKNKQIT